ncbi:MAG: aldehyde dehydrogenase family protein [Pseudobdellovibrio sp.]
MQISSFIENNFYSGEKKFNKLNPFTGEVLHEVNSCDLLGLIQAVQSAQKAYQAFNDSTPEQRQDLVRKIKSALVENKNKIIYSECLDQALPLYAYEKYAYSQILKNIDFHLSDVPADVDSIKSTGLVAVIASWNFSLKIILERLIPSLLAGNATLIKVSSRAVGTVQLLAEIILKSGVPKGLVNIIVSNEADVTKTLVQHPGIKAVSFVGRLETSIEVIKQLATISHQSFKKIQVSSGSKNSAVALAEPHELNAEEVTTSFLLGQGQLAWNSSRLFILEKSEKIWEEKLRESLAHLKPSEGIEDRSLWTPCLKSSSFDKFAEIKRQAREDQAKLIETPFVLNDAQKSRFLSPTFTKDMSRCSTLQQDQIHSPFFILSAVKYPFDVAKYSNVSYFGFMAHLWGDEERARKVAESLDVGLAQINKFEASPASDFIALKQSGYGLQDFRWYGSFYSNVKKVL